jgi:hypothetical protein
MTRVVDTTAIFFAIHRIVGGTPTAGRLVETPKPSVAAMLLQTLLLILKILLAAGLVVGSSTAVERLRPAWGGIIAAIPVSAGAAFVMIALAEPAAFVARAALGAVVTGIAAFGYLALFVRLAPNRSATISVVGGLLLWIALNVASHAVAWTDSTAIAANILAFLLCERLIRSRPAIADDRPKLRPTRRDLALRGLAVGALAAFASTAPKLLGPMIAGTLAAFPIVFLTVSFIVHRRIGGAVAAATMAAAAAPLFGVILAFLAIHLVAPVAGSAMALLVALGVSTAWPLALALRQLRLTRAVPA